MIFLVQPPVPPGMTSGGYRYNDAVGRRLERDRVGRRVDVPFERFAAAVAEIARHRATIVVDSIYLGELRDAPVDAVRLLPSTRLLLHYRPSENPLLAAGERDAWREVERASCTGVRGVIATAPRIADRVVRDFPGVRVGVAPPGMDPRFPAMRSVLRRARGPGPRTVVAVGPLTPAKGQLDVVTAAARLATVRPMRVVLVGDATIDPDYTARVVAAAGDARVETVGPVPIDELADYYRDADALVSASRLESYGMAVAEAVASGLAVVAYRAGEIDAWVRDPVEPGDVDGLTERLRAALDGDYTPLRPAFESWDDTARAFRAACETEGTP